MCLILDWGYFPPKERTFFLKQNIGKIIIFRKKTGDCIILTIFSIDGFYRLFELSIVDHRLKFQKITQKLARSQKKGDFTQMPV